MEHKTVDINEIVIHYLDGSASFEEKVELQQWLKRSDGNREDFILTRDIWLSCNVVAQNELEVDIALERLKSRIMNEYQKINKSSGRLGIHWARVAAVLLLLLGFSYGIGIYTGRSDKKVVMQNQLITAEGSKGRFTLPDGSVVWLNSGTRLTYPESFSGDRRLVSLDGGAYFEVVKDTRKPFIVKMGEINVEVLGTSFNISNYSDMDVLETALLSGRVKINGEGIHEDVILLPNQLFEYQKNDHRVVVKTVKAGLYVDWIKNRLVFDNDCLEDIITCLEGWYNVRIECPDDFARKTNMSFTIRQESLGEILSAMTSIVPMKYRQVGHKIYIEPR